MRRGGSSPYRHGTDNLETGVSGETPVSEKEEAYVYGAFRGFYKTQARGTE